MKKKIKRSHSMGTGSAIALSVGAVIVVGTVASAAVAVAGISSLRNSREEIWGEWEHEPGSLPEAGPYYNRIQDADLV